MNVNLMKPRIAMASGCLLVTTIFLNVANSVAVEPLAPCGPVPTARQIEWYHREIIAFFHFGINTFGDDINEGDGKAKPCNL